MTGYGEVAAARLMDENAVVAMAALAGNLDALKLRGWVQGGFAHGGLCPVTSGQSVEEWTRQESCPACRYHGVVDAWFDPELMQGGWKCPACESEYIVEKGAEI